jgi:hypothetical protein
MKQTNTKEAGLVLNNISIQRAQKINANLLSLESIIFWRLWWLNHSHAVLRVLLWRILRREIEGLRKPCRSPIDDVVTPWQPWRWIELKVGHGSRVGGKLHLAVW